MITMTRPKLTSGYEVEWTAHIPVDECGDADLDRADTRYESFATLEAARIRAIEVYPKDCFGCVMIRDWQYVEWDDEGLPIFHREYGNFEEVVDELGEIEAAA